MPPSLELKPPLCLAVRYGYACIRTVGTPRATQYGFDGGARETHHIALLPLLDFFKLFGDSNRLRKMLLAEGDSLARKWLSLYKGKEMAGKREYVSCSYELNSHQ